MKNNILLFIIIFFILSCGENETKIQPKASTVTESVYASGTVKARNQYNVYSGVNGLLKKILVTEGDTVKAGDPLFIIANQSAALNTENARLAVLLSEKNIRENSSRLKELEQSVKMARERFELDSVLNLRQQNLWNQNIGTKIEAEQRNLAFETSKSNYLTAKARLDQAKTQFNIEHRQAINNLKILQEIEQDHIIKSEINGLVFDIVKEQGEWVSPQTPLALLGNADRHYLAMQVDEMDISKIRLGQKVLVGMDSYKGSTYVAEVSRIYPIMNERSRTFTVEAEYIKPPPELFPNLTAEANIVIQTKEGVMVIPREYLIDNQYVLIDKNEKVSVEVGLMDYQNVEIISGLNEGQFIYKPVSP